MIVNPVTEPRTAAKRRGIDLAPEVVIRTVWQGRLQLLQITALFFGVGLLVAWLTQPEFVSEARIMPEMNSGSTDMVKRLASVAGLTGLDLEETAGIDAVRPDLYPTILQSTPFVLFLLNRAVVQTNGVQTTVATLLAPANDWWPTSWFQPEPAASQPLVRSAGNRPLQLTRRQEKLVEDIGKRVTAKLDTRSGVITITARMPDASVSAAVAQLTMDYLTQYVTSYRTEKARQDLQFYTLRLAEARRRYEQAQYRVFQYNDQHKNFVVLAATMEKQRMEAELSIAQTVYMELSRQFEQAKLKVQERTPVFKVLEPARIPRNRVSPRRTVLVLFYAVGGFLTGLLYLLVKQADLIGQLRAVLAG